MNRASLTSEKSMKPGSNRTLATKLSTAVIKEPPPPKFQEIKKHICPCDETKSHDFLTVSTQCLCEEVDVEKELVVFFYNVIMDNGLVQDYSFTPDNYYGMASYGSSANVSNISMMKTSRSKESQKDIRKVSSEDKKKTLVGAGGSQVIVKKLRKSGSKNLSKDGLQNAVRRTISAHLHPITEDNPMETSHEKLISTTNFEYDWLVKRDEKMAKITFKNGNRYEGEVCDRLPHGKGTFYWADGTIYEGDFEEGSPTGRGRMQLPDFTEYTGMFCKGFFHGNGVYNIRATSMVYSGHWKYGKKHGFGWLLYDSDVWYEGEFQDDLRDGNGFFHFKDRSCYQGQYLKNKREGRGAMRWSNNDIYIGHWSDGIINGLGEYAWRTEYNDFFSFPVQHYYKGSWVKGKRTGTGIMFFGNENGAKMAGFFQDNFKHGAAVVICGNGKSIEKNPLFYNDKPLHMPTSNEDIAKESSSVTFNEQAFQSMMKNGISEKQWPTRNRTSQVNALLDYAKQEKGALCCPIEIQIHSPPDDIDLNFYIERAMSMYVNAFDTIQFDIESTETTSSANASKLQLSKWNLFTPNSSAVPSKMVKSYGQESPARQSLIPNVPVFNKSETRFQSTVRTEEKYLRNVVIRYLPKLIEVYYHYATITSREKAYFKHYMIRMFLWQFYLDIGITKIGIPLVEIDKLLDENPASFVESCHHPFEHIYFFQFIQSLMGAALLVHHKSREEIQSAEGLTPYILQKFLLDRVFVYAGSHTGRCLFEYKDILSIKNVYALYLKLGEPHTARTFLNATCTKKEEEPPCYKSWSKNKCLHVSKSLGKNINIVGHNFFYMPEKEAIGEAVQEPMEIPENVDPFFQDLTAFRELGADVVAKCLCTICPPILKNGIICNMDYCLTFLEFYEVLIVCALMLIVRTEKKKEVFRLLKSKETKSEEMEETQDLHLRKSSGKLKKKK